MARSRTSGEYRLGRAMEPILSRNRPSDKAGTIQKGFKVVEVPTHEYRRRGGVSKMLLRYESVPFVWTKGIPLPTMIQPAMAEEAQIAYCYPVA